MALTVLCAMACVVLVYAEYTKASLVRIAAKLFASSAFVALAIVLPGTGNYAKAIVIGLVFGALGDAALLGKGSAAFMLGLVAFLIGHLAYVGAMTVPLAPGAWLAGAGVLAALPVVVGGTALVLLWPKLGSMRLPVIIYVLTIVTMVIGALAVWRTDALPSPQSDRLAIGATLFFVSDLAVARDKFVAASFVNRAWGLPAYYAGQLFIVWSMSG